MPLIDLRESVEFQNISKSPRSQRSAENIIKKQ